jgi:CHAT domain-containing protein
MDLVLKYLQTMNIRILLLLLALTVSPALFAQNVLLFPETMDYTSGDLPPNLCVKHSSELIASINSSDKEAIKELRRVGRRLMRLGYHEYAKDAFEKLLDIHTQTHQKTDPEYIMAYVDLARVYLFLIRYTEMIPMYQEAAKLMAKAKGENSYEHALILSELIEPYFYMQDFQAAEQQALKVQAILDQLGSKYNLQKGINLNNIGIVQLYTKGYEKGIEKLQEAVKILDRPQYDQQYIISTAANLAQAYALAGDKTEARSLLSSYRPRAEEKLTDKVTSYARIWLQFGRAYTALKDYASAEGAFALAYTSNSLTITEVRDIAKQAKDLFFKNQFLATCAQAGTTVEAILMYKDKFQEEQDLEALKASYTLVQTIKEYKDQLMEDFVAEENKLILFRLGASKVLESGVELAYELYQRTGEEKYLKEAFEFSEYGKSTLLIHALRTKDNRQFGFLPPLLLKKEKDYQEQKQVLQKRLIESVTDAEKQKWNTELNALNREILQFKNKIAQNFPKYYEHHYQKDAVDLEDLQAGLNENTALVEYMLANDRSFAFIISKKQVEMVDLRINYQKMNRNADQLRHSLSDYIFIRDQQDLARQEFIASSSYFYQAFVAPLITKVEGVKKLIIIPDRELGHLPFEVFLKKIPQPDQPFKEMEYLAKDFAISYSYSATVLLEKKAQDAKRKAKESGVLAFAGYYGDPQQLALADSLKRRSNLRSIRSALQPLPGAEAEVDLMRDYLLGEFFDGPIAGEATFKAKASDFDIIHLAMHGLLNGQDPILSSLAFSEDGNIDEDNFLHAYEISELELNARLVVLSACETGYGKFRQGEGVMSLAHSFMYAGASSVLVSLWQVNDAATGKIMKYYYFAMSVGFEKDEALRIAKLKYLEEANGIQAHPAFWAAFIQMGDTTEIDLYCKAGWTFWQKVEAIGAAILLVLIGLFIWRWRRTRKLQ